MLVTPMRKLWERLRTKKQLNDQADRREEDLGYSRKMVLKLAKLVCLGRNDAEVVRSITFKSNNVRP